MLINARWQWRSRAGGFCYLEHGENDFEMTRDAGFRSTESTKTQGQKLGFLLFSGLQTSHDVQSNINLTMAFYNLDIMFIFSGDVLHFGVYFKSLSCASEPISLQILYKGRKTENQTLDKQTITIQTNIRPNNVKERQNNHVET